MLRDNCVRTNRIKGNWPFGFQSIVTCIEKEASQYRKRKGISRKFITRVIFLFFGNQGIHKYFYEKKSFHIKGLGSFIVAPATKKIARDRKKKKLEVGFINWQISSRKRDKRRTMIRKEIRRLNLIYPERSSKL